MSLSDPPLEDESIDTLPLRELRRLAGGHCRDCTIPYKAREAVWSVALGLKDAPRCLPCLARRLGRSQEDLRRQLIQYVARRDCYRIAAEEADRLDGETSPLDAEPDTPPARSGEAITPTPDAEWDAGGMGCGELVMELRKRLNNLPPGSVIKVRATDPAAPEDIPAWCRLCGHALASADHPHYYIRRRES